MKEKHSRQEMKIWIFGKALQKLAQPIWANDREKQKK